MNWVNGLIIFAYMGAMLLFGWWGQRRTSTTDDYFVAGRRLGPVLYTGTMVAVVLGGAAAIGGVGLGYKYGISGLWLVTAIGLGVVILSLVFAPIIQRLKIYTVCQMLTLRYGSEATQASSVVLVYSIVGGMWSITLADMAQFTLMTLGTFALMLPISLHRAGGWDGLHSRLDETFFDITGIGAQSIITYFVVYTLGLLIGQDIWQRVFTARSDSVARWGGVTAGLYCILFGIVGAIIGMAAAVIIPGVEQRDDVFALVATNMLPVGIGGLALASGVAAMMSTASGGLIAAATVAKTDVVPLCKKVFSGSAPRTLSPTETDQLVKAEMEQAAHAEDELSGNRAWVLGLGLVALALAIAVPDVVAALTIAYDILVGGLLVAIIGGIVWMRGTGVGAMWSMIFGVAGTLLTMGVLEVRAEERFDGVFANEPIYVGLALSLIAYIAASLLSQPTHPAVLENWKRRASGATGSETEAAPTPAPRESQHKMANSLPTK